MAVRFLAMWFCWLCLLPCFALGDEAKPTPRLAQAANSKAAAIESIGMYYTPSLSPFTPEAIAFP